MIVISIFLSIVIFTPLEIENTWLRMLLHLLLLPIIVAVTYEFNRYVGRAQQSAVPNPAGARPLDAELHYL